jgi:MOSC domain-containing protein YiiM
MNDSVSKLSSMGKVRRLQIGEALPFAREQTSAINKYKVDSVEVINTGFVGDEQADQFFHGGHIQAVHQMPIEVYQLIKDNFPAVIIYEGMLGENIIIGDMKESSVCIGDIYQVGSVQMQITRPRRPCWKIDSLLNKSGVAKFLQDHKCIGWYYKILKTGVINHNDECFLIERLYPFANLDRLWDIYNDKSFKDPVEIEKWLQIEPLERSFKEILKKRLI